MTSRIITSPRVISFDEARPETVSGALADHEVRIETLEDFRETHENWHQSMNDRLDGITRLLKLSMAIVSSLVTLSGLLIIITRGLH
jgi:hypothetical protein